MHIMEIEIWKDIKGYEGYYQISNFSRVKSLSRLMNRKGCEPHLMPERIMKGFYSVRGYYSIILVKETVNKNFHVHRITASHFIDNFDKKPQVNHKDGDKNNNHVSNLEWVTCSENIRHAYSTGLKKGRQAFKNEYKIKPVLHQTYGIYYKSLKEASKDSVYNYKYLSGMLRGIYPNKSNLSYA